MRPGLFLLPLLPLAVALPAFAQEAEVQRALIEQDQRSAQFAARLQGAPLVELQRMENLAARQLVESGQPRAPELRPYERQSAARETEAFVLQLPPPKIRARALEKLGEFLEPQRPAAADITPSDR